MARRSAPATAAPSGAAVPRLAGIYLRISKDTENDELGIRRQEKECRALAARLGWTIAEVFTDNDTSAYQKRVRPAFRRMQDAVRSGRLNAIIAKRSDRLARPDLRDLEDLIDFLDETEVACQTVSSGAYDVTTADGKMIARMLGTIARHSSELTAERIEDKMVELRDGGWWRGGQAPYGYRLDRKVVDGAKRTTLIVVEDQAEVIRRCADAVLAGRSLRSIADELNRDQVPAVRPARDGSPGRWFRETIRDLIIRPTVAGRVTYKRKDAGPAQWPAILPYDRWLVVRDVLTDPARKRAKEPTKSLLAGLVFKAGTDQRLTIHIGPKPLRKRMYYLHTTDTPEGEPGVSIDAEALEDHVVKYMFDALEERGPIAAEEEQDGGTADALAAIEAQAAELADDFYVQKLISRPEFLRARRGLEEQRTALLAAAKMTRRADLGVQAWLQDIPALRAAWEADQVTFDDQRRAVKALIARVEVAPGGQGRTFVSQRVVVTLAE